MAYIAGTSDSQSEGQHHQQTIPLPTASPFTASSANSNARAETHPPATAFPAATLIAAFTVLIASIAPSGGSERLFA